VAQTNRKVLKNRPNIVIMMVMMIMMMMMIIIMIIIKSENTNTYRYDNASHKKYHAKGSRKEMKENTRVYV
jgi:uncharacterized membrane protein YhaH (DUF805 family)